MTYKASYDTLTKALSLLVVAVLLTAVGTIIARAIAGTLQTPLFVSATVLLLTVAALLGSWLYAPQYYILTDDALIIKRAVKDVSINLHDISGVSPKDSLPIIRLFGVGGLFGYFGLYYSREMGRMHVYCTQQSHLVFIKTKTGYPIIISPDEDLLFISDLRAKLKAL